MTTVDGHAARRRSSAQRWDGVAIAAALVAFIPLALAGLGYETGSLVLALIAALAVLVLLLGREREAATSVFDFIVPASGFLLGLLALALSMDPMAPGGVHPLWAPVGAGAAVLDRQSALEALLGMAGLGALFVVAAIVGARSDRIRSAVSLFQGLLCLAQLSLLAVVLAQVLHVAPGVIEVGLAPLFAGLALLLSLAAILQAWKTDRPKRFTARLRAAPASLSMAALSIVTLLILGGPGGLIATICAVLVFAVWEFLARSGEGSLRRAPLFLSLGLLSLVIVGAGVLAFMALGPAAGTPQATSDNVHFRALWASPWLGYGPGSSKIVGRLFMDRLNLSALLASPVPTSGYLVALEQVGFLAFIPISISFVAVLLVLADASSRRRRLGGLYRASVSCSVFAALFAAVSTAPVTLAGAAPLVFLLGCGFGAARGAR